MNGFKAFFEFEDGALEEVVRDSGGGYGQAEGEQNGDEFVPVEIHHAGPVSTRAEEHPEKECVKDVEAIRDLSQIDKGLRNSELDVYYGKKDKAGTEEHEKECSDQRRLRLVLKVEQSLGA